MSAQQKEAMNAHASPSLQKIAEPESSASAASPILIAARDLAKALHDHNQLDEASLELGQKRRGQAQAQAARELALDVQIETVSARANALEELIGVTRAATLGEAMVQIALATGYLERLRGEEEHGLHSPMWRFLSSALAVMLRESGIDPAAYGLTAYVGRDLGQSPWPEKERDTAA
jgi:hypothetical protein